MSETIRDVVVRVSLKQIESDLKTPNVKPAIAELKKFGNTGEKSVHQVRNQLGNLVRNELAEFERKSKEARTSAVERLGVAREEGIKAAEGFQTAAEGALTMARGLTLLGAEGDEGLKDLVESLAKIQGLIDITKGAKDVLKGVSEGMNALRTASAASAAAQASLAVANTSVATTATTAATASKALAVSINPITAAVAAVTTAVGVLAVAWANSGKEAKEARRWMKGVRPEDVVESSVGNFSLTRILDPDAAAKADNEARRKTLENKRDREREKRQRGSEAEDRIRSIFESNRVRDIRQRGSVFDLREQAGAELRNASPQERAKALKAESDSLAVQNGWQKEIAVIQERRVSLQSRALDFLKQEGAMREKNLSKAREELDVVKKAVAAEKARTQSLTERIGSLGGEDLLRLKSISKQQAGGGPLSLEQAGFLKNVGIGTELASKRFQDEGRSRGASDILAGLGEQKPLEMLAETLKATQSKVPELLKRKNESDREIANETIELLRLNLEDNEQTKRLISNLRAEVESSNLSRR